MGASSAPREQRGHLVGDRSRALFDAAPIAMVLVDDDARWIDCNPAAEHLFEQDRANLVGRSLLDDLVTDERLRWRRFRADGRQSGQLSIRTGSGTIRATDYDAVADVEPGVHLVTLRAVSETGFAEAVLRVHPDRMWVLTNDGVIRAITDASLSAFPEGAVVGRRIHELFDADGVAIAEEMIREVLATRSLVTRQVPSPTDPDRWFEMRMVPIGDDAVLSLARDVTDRWRAEDRLRRRTDLDAAVARITPRLVAATTTDLRAVIDEALAEVSRVVGSDATTLVVSPDGDHWRREYAWFDPAMGPLPEVELSGFPISRSRRTEGNVWSGEVAIVRSDDDDLPATVFRSVMHDMGAQAGAVVPIRAGESVHAFLAFYWRRPGVRAELDDESLPTLRAIGGALSIAHARSKAEGREAKVSALLRTTFDTIDVAILVSAPDGRFTSANRAACELLGLDPSDIIGTNLADYPTPLREDLTPFTYDELPTLATLRDGRPRADVIVVVPGELGQLRWLRVNTRRLEPQSDDGWSVITTLTDITVLRTLHAQLGQHARMEALGRLAGGVAHDFNNLLTVLTGYTSLLMHELDAESPVRADVEEMATAVERGAALIDQLLSFSRRKVAPTTTLDLNEVMSAIAPMLQRSLPAGCALDLRPHAAPALVQLDRVQLERVVLNLVINAGDAMPDGGTVTVETSRVRMAVPGPHPDDAPIGTYVVLTVADTGVGMDAATRARAFEPFFTTKSLTHGTGLGLSTVYGIVTAAGGHVSADGDPGGGSTFRVYLPAVEEVTEDEEQGGAPSTRLGGVERVLLVEDDPNVRRFAAQGLVRLGYEVVTARSAAEARERAAGSGGFDLVISDVVLPDGRGPGLVEDLRASGTDVPAVLISGFADTPVDIEGHPADAFVAKPFRIDDLARTIRGAIDRGVDHGDG